MLFGYGNRSIFSSGTHLTLIALDMRSSARPILPPAGITCQRTTLAKLSTIDHKISEPLIIEDGGHKLVPLPLTLTLPLPLTLTLTLPPRCITSGHISMSHHSLDLDTPRTLLPTSHQTTTTVQQEFHR